MSYADELAADLKAAGPSNAERGTYASQLAADLKAAQKPKMAVAPELPINPTGSTMQNFLAGAGKGISDLGTGAKQVLDIPAVWLESKFPGLSRWSQAQGMPSAADSAAQTNAGVEETRRLDKPLMDTTAGTLGSIVGQAAGIMLPGAALSRVVPAAGVLVAPTTYGGAITAGAVQGALQPTTKEDNRLLNTAVGGAAGAAGNAAVNLVGRIAQPVARTLSQAHAKAVQTLEDAGIPLDAAQRTGSTVLNRMRSGLNDNPFTAGTQADLRAVQQAGFNRAVLRTVGEDATAATPAVMRAAEDRINGVFKDVLSRNQVLIDDPSFLSRLGSIQQAANDVEKRPISNLADRIIASADANGNVPGKVAYAIKKDLDRISSGPDTTLSYWARQLNTALKDQMTVGMPAEDAAALTLARTQFAKLRTIEPAIDKMGAGDISAARLSNSLATKANRKFSLYGRGDTDLVDLAQSGNLLLGDKMPNSGTTARAATQLAIGALGGGVVGGGTAVATGNYENAIQNAAIGAAGGIALPKLGQAIINNPATAGYLQRGLDPGALRTILTAPQTQPLLGGAVRQLIPAAALSQLGNQ
jgi:hypothetical protein